MTPEQTENLAKHFFGRALDAKYGPQTDAKKLEKWNQWTGERTQFLGYAAILADMFPDCLAPYIDTTPF